MPTQCDGYREHGGGKVASVTIYRKVTIPNHPLAQADGKVYVHRVVLYAKIGPGSHPCHWCKAMVTWGTNGPDDLLPDHVDGDGWNNSADNLVPSCSSCNIMRGRLAKRPDALTHCKAGHEYTPENTYTRPDNGCRQCRACKKIAFDRLQAKRKRATT